MRDTRLGYFKKKKKCWKTHENMKPRRENQSIGESRFSSYCPAWCPAEFIVLCKLQEPPELVCHRSEVVDFSGVLETILKRLKIVVDFV
jgi:hypothetical protein